MRILSGLGRGSYELYSSMRTVLTLSHPWNLVLYSPGDLLAMYVVVRALAQTTCRLNRSCLGHNLERPTGPKSDFSVLQAWYLATTSPSLRLQRHELAQDHQLARTTVVSSLVMLA